MEKPSIRIAVDAMGGDFAPAAPVEGSVWAAREYGQPVVLVGVQREIEEELGRLSGVPRSLIEIQDAPEVVGMDEPAAAAFKKKKRASIRVCFELVKAGFADGVVSAGNSGATMTGAALVLGRTVGVDRPAIAGIFPTLKGSTVVIDVGANVNCKPQNLFQFGIMGDIYARDVLKIAEPRVGLLNVGEERIKGNELVKQVHELLSRTDLNFIGNVEGRDIFTGSTQVIICDGFVGNVCLKLTESLGSVFSTMLLTEMRKNWTGRVGLVLAKKAIARFYRKLDYTEHGGAPLLGVNGAGVVCHGASPPKALKNAIRVAIELVRMKVNQSLAEGLEAFSLKHS